MVEDPAAGVAQEYGGIEPSPLPAPIPLPRPRRSRTLIAVSAVVIAAVLVVALLAWGLGTGGFHPLGGGGPPTPPSVEVRVLKLGFAPGNQSCFYAPYQSTHAETVVAGGEFVFNVTLQDQNSNNAHSCTVTGLSVTTPGFVITSSNVPLDIGSSSGTLSFTLTAPTTTFNGSVNVTANVTFQAPNVHVAAQNFGINGGSGLCGTVSASGTGFSGFSGGRYSDSALVIVISPLSSCSITGIGFVGTSPFSIGSTNLPVQLPIDSFTSVTFELNLPSSGFTGDLNYTLTLA